jgi:hypothetical protein
LDWQGRSLADKHLDGRSRRRRGEEEEGRGGKGREGGRSVEGEEEE